MDSMVTHREPKGNSKGAQMETHKGTQKGHAHWMLNERTLKLNMGVHANHS